MYGTGVTDNMMTMNSTEAQQTNRSDKELIQGMLHREEAAFNEFFRCYFPRIYRFALTRLDNDAQAAEEIVQSTLIRAIRNLKGYRGEAALFTWVCQICRNQISDYFRSARRLGSRVAMIEDSPEIRAALESLAAPSREQPQQRYRDAEISRLVRVVLDTLPGRYGSALELKYIDGLSVEQIGLRLSISATAAQSLLARARAAFKDGATTVFEAAGEALTGLDADDGARIGRWSSEM